MESSLRMSRQSMSMGTNEIDFLKETLHAQQELLQKLYAELDVEQESSATAADEALSMILRLQGEKSAMEMEASQYKRIAEEKMFHAQETVETFQELIYQKEMQIASLEFQVQAYKFKLVSMGCDDLGGFEMNYPENLLSRVNGAPGETSHGSLRRGSSVPPPSHYKPLSRRRSMEGVKSMQSSPKIFHGTKDVDTPFRREKTTTGGDVNTYWEEIRKLEERVKELDTIHNFNTVPNPDTIHNFNTVPNPENPTNYCSPCESPTCDHSPGSSPKYDTHDDSPTSVVQDIYEVKEVPQYSDHNKGKGKITNEKLSTIWDTIWKSEIKDKIDHEKRPLLSPTNNNNMSPRPKDTKSLLSPTSHNGSSPRFEWRKKPLMVSSPRSTDELSKLGKTVESSTKHSLLRQGTCNVGVADFELQQFNRRLRQLEDDRFMLKINEIGNETGDEQLVLLKEIRDKIDSMQVDITSWTTKKPVGNEELLSTGVLQQAMLCFLP